MRKLTLLCRIVDNLGDAGVALRFARQWLYANPGDCITLCTDQLQPYLRLLARSQVEDANTSLPGLTFLETLDPPASFDWGDIIIEMFGTPVPRHWKPRLAERNPPPAWVNLEYLSAEEWIEDCHGLWSSDPETGWKQLFFFPGFTEKSGGLLGEEERSHVAPETMPANTATATHQTTTTSATPTSTTTANPAPRAAPRRAKHASNPTLRAFVFAYTLAPMAPWLEHPSEKIAFEVANASRTGELRKEIVDTLERVNFVAQTEFDNLLKTYDLLFVRGEDSFVRAQLAGIPMVWQIYPTTDNAHWSKLEAFFQRYAEGLSEPAQGALKNLWWYWNGAPLEHIDAKELLEDVVAHMDTLKQHAMTWREAILPHCNLLERLEKTLGHASERA